jgi:ribosomal protein S18 acetylase RimI-like enzyme
MISPKTAPAPIPTLTAVPAHRYSIEQLTDIYNQCRVDYIVPMPMNAKRMSEYIGAYNINLEESVVILDPLGEISALSMLGVRGTRAWVSRLGVIPNKRRSGTGQFIMEQHINSAHRCGVTHIQLEVIKDNHPAHQLFLKNGFQETRQLTIIRRPPGLPDPELAPTGMEVKPLTPGEIEHVLDQRSGDHHPSWTEESLSLKNGGRLMGFQISLPSGVSGSLVYQSNPFQLTHLAMCGFSEPNHEELEFALLYQLHRQHPQHDTKVENLWVDAALWNAYKRMGYLEVFRRIEMILSINK